MRCSLITDSKKASRENNEKGAGMHASQSVFDETDTEENP